MTDIKQNTNHEDSEVVALVNDEKIVRNELDSYLNQIATIQKFPLPDKETEERKQLEHQALDQMINNILLFQDAENQGITVSKEEIDSQYLTLANQVGGEEKLNQALERTGITAKHLRDDLNRQNVIGKYFDFVKEKNEISVSEEEIKAFYDQEVAPKNPNLEFKAVEPQIRQRVEQQKLNQPVSEIIQNLRQEAEIKILL